MDIQSFFETTLTSAISNTDLTIVLNTAPTPTLGYLVIDPDNTNTREEIYFSTRSGSTLTCPADGRGKDGTSAIAHNAGVRVIMALVKPHYDILQDGTNLDDGSIATAKIADDAVTAAKLGNNAILLDYAEITTSFTTTTVNSYVDVTNLTVTVTVPDVGRKVKITGFAVKRTSSAVAGTFLDFTIREGSTVLNSSSVQLSTSGYNAPAQVMWIGTPTAGSHTYKISIQQTAAGTYTLGADTTLPAFILCELI